MNSGLDLEKHIWTEVRWLPVLIRNSVWLSLIALSACWGLLPWCLKSVRTENRASNTVLAQSSQGEANSLWWLHKCLSFSITIIYSLLPADILCDSAETRNSKSSLSHYYCDYRHILYSQMEIVLKVLWHARRMFKSYLKSLAVWISWIIYWLNNEI